MAYTSGRLYSGEKTGVTVTAEAVSTTTNNIREAIIQSDPSNTTNVLVGNADAQEIVLTPGQSINIPIISLSLVFVKMASSTGTINWLARD
jgi:hypothetical protein